MQLHGIGVNTRVSLGGNAMLYSSVQEKLLKISLHRAKAASVSSYIHELLLKGLLLYQFPPLVLGSSNPVNVRTGRDSVGKAKGWGCLVRELERSPEM